MNMLAGQSVLVLGLGESGVAMAQWCARSGAQLRIADSRAHPPGLDGVRGLAGVQLHCAARFDGSEPQLLDGIDWVAISPGIDPEQPLLQQARARGLPVKGEMTLFAEALEALGVRAHCRIVAITGTNGKTTTTALTARLCQAAGRDAVAAGNISPSALAVLMQRQDEGRALPDCWVLELSSFQLETMQGLQPDAACVLNLSDDHLDRHRTLEAYAQAKARIFEGRGVQVLNRDDPLVAAMQRRDREPVWVSLGVPVGERDFGVRLQQDEAWLYRGGEPLLTVSALRLSGRHNLFNALAALALADAVGCAPHDTLPALRDFSGLAHRMQCVAERADGVRFYDDSKGTNVGATLAALQGLGRPVVLIAGGDGKGQDFSPLCAAAREHARAVVLIGRDAQRIAQALLPSGVALHHAQDMDSAVALAARLARPGEAVLLSPACASLDMFRNYAHRAEVFVQAVRMLEGVRAC